MKIYAANWKMHKTIAEAESFVDILLTKPLRDDPILLFPPFTTLPALQKRCADSPIALGAQNCFYEEKGAYTGEIALSMLTEISAQFVLVGHSERRHIFHEPNDWMGKKCASAWTAGVQPLLCIGEKEEERQAGRTAQTLAKQLSAVFPFLQKEKPPSFIVAYEPVWAIGTGNPCREDEAEKQALWIKEWLHTEGYRGGIKVLYGGSVKPANAKAFMERDAIDGTLVGGASLDPEAFYQIITCLA